MEQDITRKRLGSQLATARRERRWKLDDVSRRTASAPSRISVIENGKANSTIDTLAQAGEAVGLSLTFVPTDKLEKVLALLGQAPPASTAFAKEVPSVYDEYFIPDPDEDENEAPHVRP